MRGSQFTIVNVAGSAPTGVHLDLARVAALLNGERHSTGVVYRPRAGGVVVVSARGTLSMKGQQSIAAAESAVEEVIGRLRSARMVADDVRPVFIPSNLVATTRIELPRPFEQVLQSLPFEVEYEPESFPAAILRCNSPRFTALLFQSGSLSVMGVQSEDEVVQVIEVISEAVS